MAVIYDDEMKNVRMTATRDRVADGTLEILTAADGLLVTYSITLAGGTVTLNVWEVAVDAYTVAATGAGDAAKAQIKDSAGVARITGLTAGIAGSGAEVIIDNVNIAVDQNVTLQQTSISPKITHAA